MRGVLLVLAVLCALAGAARAQVAETDQAAIADVIGRQMEAFARDDDAAAFGFASPSLQEMFGSADHFMAMVRTGYQPVYRPRSTRFGDLRDEDGRIVQEVGVIGPDGAPRVALYTMERQPDGSWRISGCTLVDAPKVDS